MSAIHPSPCDMLPGLLYNDYQALDGWCLSQPFSTAAGSVGSCFYSKDRASKLHAEYNTKNVAGWIPRKHGKVVEYVGTAVRFCTPLQQQCGVKMQTCTRS